MTQFPLIKGKDELIIFKALQYTFYYSNMEQGTMDKIVKGAQSNIKEIGLCNHLFETLNESPPKIF